MSTVDPKEIEYFENLSDQWWDESGKFKPLHDFNPVRIEYILSHIKNKKSRQKGKSFAGLKLLDIGCGGGLLSVPMAKLGADVLGVDAGENNIKVANFYKKKHKIENIKFLCSTAEQLSRRSKFDIILAMEVVEHVADVELFIKSLCELLKPGGALFISTINKTIIAYMKAIIGAEYILRLLPKGTHQWLKFVKPETIKDLLYKYGVNVCEIDGLSFNPFNSRWKLSYDDSVNYILYATKPLAKSKL